MSTIKWKTTYTIEQAKNCTDIASVAKQYGFFKRSDTFKRILLEVEEAHILI